MRTDPDTDKRSQPKLKILDRCQNPLQNKHGNKPSIFVQDPIASRRREHHSGLAQDQRSSILTKVPATAYGEVLGITLSQGERNRKGFVPECK